MDSLYAIKKSIKNYASGGNVLIVATLLAFIIANSPIADMYFSWWAQPISLQLGDFNLFSHNGHPMTVMEFINDALMAIYFFSIGLEIKREVLVGELTSIKQALLPIVAAIGGMVIPVLLFMYIGRGSDFLRGSAIPMATDIAFSLGVLAMLGRPFLTCVKTSAMYRAGRARGRSKSSAAAGASPRWPTQALPTRRSLWTTAAWPATSAWTL